MVEIVSILKSIYSFFVRKKVKLDDLLKFNVCICMYICIIRYKINFRDCSLWNRV